MDNSETIEVCQKQLEACIANSNNTSDDARVNASFQLAWALAHSHSSADVELAIRMLEDPRTLGNKAPTREYHYTLAAAHYRLNDYLACRSAVNKALEISPSCHQSLELRDAAVEAIARDGLIGLGVIAGGVAVVGTLIAALAKPRR
eukprot:CAMPEP_0114268206 /NCGR_PEP_ID=MMETSP0058-20121206/25803_1 /TAXON_ID=36894 /ORGANISM="Pyramimonas parkeae, CCMP726" /LENGTH=146 /DNA_ID=CAMNT_0001386305 /DNA_START=410 /DNA_END=851 /DNA_ORIENTATION=-